MTTMYATPTSLSPSRVEAFTSCPLAFRFSSIEKLPEPATVHTAKGTLVHRVLELLFQHPGAERTRARAAELFPQAWHELVTSSEYLILNPSAADAEALSTASSSLVERYFSMEDPTAIEPVGTELWLEASLGELQLRGIIDRLDRAADGSLVVTDYKTGRAPPPAYEQRRLGGVHFYAWLVEQAMGERPSAIRLVYLASQEVITAAPSEQSIRFLPKRTGAIYQAIQKACTTGDFKPQPGALCNSCAFQRWCPSFGGDPAKAAAEAPLVYAVPAVPA
jgi:putative RecB family exonuclease